jgi:hypothetical protein
MLEEQRLNDMNPVRTANQVHVRLAVSTTSVDAEHGILHAVFRKLGQCIGTYSDLFLAVSQFRHAGV